MKRKTRSSRWSSKHFLKRGNLFCFISYFAKIIRDGQTQTTVDSEKLCNPRNNGWCLISRENGNNQLYHGIQNIFLTHASQLTMEKEEESMQDFDQINILNIYIDINETWTIKKSNAFWRKLYWKLFLYQKPGRVAAIVKTVGTF